MGYAKGKSTERKDANDSARANERLQRYGSAAAPDQAVGQAREFLTGDSLLRITSAVLADGGAIILSQTRDGGALAIKVLLGVDTFKYYAANLDEWEALVQKLAGF